MAGDCSERWRTRAVNVGNTLGSPFFSRRPIVLQPFQRITPLIVLLTAWCVGSSGMAARPNEDFLPTTTKGFISAPNLAVLRSRFEATQLGELLKDPVMKPFLDDMREQISNKMNRPNGTLSLTWEELESVATGEVTLATTQPWDKKAAAAELDQAVKRAVAEAKKKGVDDLELEQTAVTTRQDVLTKQERARRALHASVLIANVTGRVAETQQLLVKVDAEFRKRKATRTPVTVAGTKLSLYELPKEFRGKSFRQTYVGVVGNYLFACDNLPVAEEVIQRMTRPTAESLATVPAFRAAMDRSQAGFAGHSAPHLRWFIEPFGYAEVVRATSLAQQKRKRDMLKVLANQGFDAIQGLGGWVLFDTDGCEIVHRSFIYAPPIHNAESGNRYHLAANMLDFPNGGSLEPLAWVPRDLGFFTTFNWRTKKAFYASETLVNEYASDDVFDEVIHSMKHDSNGPRVDLERDLVAHLGDRALVISDHRTPINPKSERVIFAVEVTNAAVVAKTVNKAMEADKSASPREYEGHVIWEIINEQEPKVDKLEVSGEFGFDTKNNSEDTVEEENKHHIPNSAVTVAYDHLIIATHVDAIVEILKPLAAKNRLADAADYQQVQAMMRRLSPNTGSFQIFSRTDEALCVTYELFRQGKMPEAESFFGRLLNRVFEDDGSTEVRKAEFRGDKLPDFQVVRRYLGPAGVTVQSEADGWSVSGALLAK